MSAAYNSTSYAKASKKLDDEETAARNKYNRIIAAYSPAALPADYVADARRSALADLNRALADIDARRAALKKSSKNNTFDPNKNPKPVSKPTTPIKYNMGEDPRLAKPKKYNMGDDPKRTSSPPPQKADTAPDNTKQPVIYSPQQSLPPKTNSQVHPITGGDKPVASTLTPKYGAQIRANMGGDSPKPTPTGLTLSSGGGGSGEQGKPTGTSGNEKGRSAIAQLADVDDTLNQIQGDYAPAAVIKTLLAAKNELEKRSYGDTLNQIRESAPEAVIKTLQAAMNDLQNQGKSNLSPEQQALETQLARVNESLIELQGDNVPAAVRQTLLAAKNDLETKTFNSAMKSVLLDGNPESAVKALMSTNNGLAAKFLSTNEQILSMLTTDQKRRIQSGDNVYDVIRELDPVRQEKFMNLSKESLESMDPEQKNDLQFLQSSMLYGVDMDNRKKLLQIIKKNKEITPGDVINLKVFSPEDLAHRGVAENAADLFNSEYRMIKNGTSWAQLDMAAREMQGEAASMVLALTLQPLAEMYGSSGGLGRASSGAGAAGSADSFEDIPSSGGRGKGNTIGGSGDLDPAKATYIPSNKKNNLSGDNIDTGLPGGEGQTPIKKGTASGGGDAGPAGTEEPSFNGKGNGGKSGGKAGPAEEKTPPSKQGKTNNGKGKTEPADGEAQPSQKKNANTASDQEDAGGGNAGGRGLRKTSNEDPEATGASKPAASARTAQPAASGSNGPAGSTRTAQPAASGSDQPAGSIRTAQPAASGPDQPEGSTRSASGPDQPAGSTRAASGSGNPAETSTAAQPIPQPKEIKGPVRAVWRDPYNGDTPVKVVGFAGEKGGQSYYIVDGVKGPVPGEKLTFLEEEPAVVNGKPPLPENELTYKPRRSNLDIRNDADDGDPEGNPKRTGNGPNGGGGKRERILFRSTPELEHHIRYADPSIPRSRGIGGAHNSKEFFKNDIKIVRSIPSRDIPGVTYYEYNMPLLGKDGKPIGGYGKTVFHKTVYDEDIFPHSEYIKRGLEAANDSYETNDILKDHWEGYDSQEVKWIGYGKDGKPTSFFPDVPEQ